MKILLDLNEQEIQKLLDMFGVDDCGPEGYGWQSDEWIALEEKFTKAVLVGTDRLKVEQRIVGIEMLVEEFATDRNKEISLHDYFEITPNEAYDYCDEIYGGDSQHIRAKAEPIKLSPKIRNT